MLYSKKRRRIFECKKSGEDDGGGGDGGGEDEKEDNEEEEFVYRRGTAVFFCSEVTKKSVFQLRKKLDEAAKAALTNSNTIDKPRVVLYISSHGGDAFAGFSAASVVKRSPVPVVTVADGYLASAATFILLAAETRYIVEGAHVLIHSLSTDVSGTFSEVKDDVQNCIKIMSSMKHIYETRTKLPSKKIEKLLKRELDLSTQQCIKYGIVESLVPY